MDRGASVESCNGLSATESLYIAGMAQHLKVGDKAPDFVLLDQSEKVTKLSSLKGRKVLVYFYPKV